MPISNADIRSAWSVFKKMETELKQMEADIQRKEKTLRAARQALDDAKAAHDALFKKAAMARYHAQDLETKQQFEQGKHS